MYVNEVLILKLILSCFLYFKLIISTSLPFFYLFLVKGVARVSCKNLLQAGYTSSGTYSLKINGRSFQVSSYDSFSVSLMYVFDVNIDQVLK